ncbi:MAG: (2S)-methylsuccinyl-CoA dehydrogenase [Alphaproteobacteria bacterium]|jgi:(2S)-methylsuccinyl-CoA dehydrogenase|nr:(2S)-methylsuccinyl-CoA dehydrogenase [Alphaproteobacteria bacterium]
MPPHSVPEAGHDLVAMAEDAISTIEALLADAIVKVRGRVAVNGRIVGRLFAREQRAAHGIAWLAAYVEALRQFAADAERIHSTRGLSQVQELLVRIGLGEYLAQIFGGISMNQGEVVRLSDLGLSQSEISARMTPLLEALIASGNTAQRRALLVDLIRAQHDTTFVMAGLDDTLEPIRDEMRRFTASEVIPQAQQWHLSNSYIPLEIIARLAELGVFGLTIPEDFGGTGLGKEAMCVVAEELSRGYIGVGSLGTRAEMAAELILRGGTENQKRQWLPKIAAGQALPTAAFSEPSAGSDLASIRTRAVREGGVYKVYGNKTWITHAARADLMLLLVRTDPKASGHHGLSMLLAQKPRGSDDDPFPVPGISGAEIAALGYRGMKQYEIMFDGFEVPVSALLGGVEGAGFKQLMQTFETVRIQTAARSVGLAQSAMEQALGYSAQRMQFGARIIDFPRVSDKIAMMAADIAIARQLTYFAARKKDSGGRCDLEASMAKLLAGRAAWAAADNAVQIHGGNGYALEFPVSRILCDARVLNIFEGSAEILALLIARQLLTSPD